MRRYRVFDIEVTAPVDSYWAKHPKVGVWLNRVVSIVMSGSLLLGIWLVVADNDYWVWSCAIGTSLMFLWHFVVLKAYVISRTTLVEAHSYRLTED